MRLDYQLSFISWLLGIEDTDAVFIFPCRSSQDYRISSLDTFLNTLPNNCKQLQDNANILLMIIRRSAVCSSCPEELTKAGFTSGELRLSEGRGETRLLYTITAI